jgi:hypothetical protein
MRRGCLLISIPLAWVLTWSFTPHCAAEEAAPVNVKAVLELSQQFFYAGDPLLMRVSIGNDGDKTVANPVKTPLFQGFEVRAAGGGS